MSHFIPTGTGPKGERFGRDPVTGRAYKGDGTLRKERVTKSPEQQLAAIAEAERRAAGTMGRKVLAALAAFAPFIAAFGTFRKWVREAKAYGTVEGIAARRASLERQLANLTAKHEAAKRFLAEQGDAISKADGVFSRMGMAYISHGKANGTPTADDVADMAADVIDEDAIGVVVSAADPANDPFAAFRRDAVADEADEADEDGDNL
jgi:hypothetical protein